MRIRARCLTLLILIGSLPIVVPAQEILATLKPALNPSMPSVQPAAQPPSTEYLLSVVPATIKKGDQQVAAFKMTLTVNRRGQPIALSSAGVPIGRSFETIVEADPCNPGVIRAAVIQYAWKAQPPSDIPVKVSFPPPGATSRTLIEIFFSASPAKMAQYGAEVPAYAVTVTAKRNGASIPLISNGLSLASRYETLIAQAVPCPPKQIRVQVVEAAPNPSDPASLPMVASFDPASSPLFTPFAAMQ